jgi:hypothetical protein
MHEKKTFPLEIYRQIHSTCSSIGKINDRIKMSVIVAYAIDILQLYVKYQQTHSVCRDIGDCDICSKYFATLCKIPTV